MRTATIDVGPDGLMIRAGIRIDVEDTTALLYVFADVTHDLSSPDAVRNLVAALVADGGRNDVADARCELDVLRGQGQADAGRLELCQRWARTALTVGGGR